MGFRSDVPPFAMLRAFDAYAQTGGVRRAAAELGVSHAIVSRHLRSLEERLGVMLIDRHRGGLTASGQDYHAHVALAFDQISAATIRLSGGPASKLNVWCIPGLAYHWLTARLPSFSAAHPSAALDLRPTDSAPDLLRRQADADIRWVLDRDQHGLPAGLKAVELARPRIFPVARPDAPWLQLSRLDSIQAIVDLPLLHEESDDDWREWLAAYGLKDVRPNMRARLWQAHMTLAAAAEGQGVALTNHFLAADHLRSGRLVEIGFTSQRPEPVTIGSYRFVAREENWEVGPCAWFRRWIAETIRSEPEDTGRFPSLRQVACGLTAYR